jgi:hypothetical protein
MMQLVVALPLIRLPAPSPRQRGEENCRTASAHRNLASGKSPLPASGERVRVRGFDNAASRQTSIEGAR